MANHEKRMVTIISPKSKNPLFVEKQKRNDKCSCGSGKKVKNCCGEKENYYTKNKQQNGN